MRLLTKVTVTVAGVCLVLSAQASAEEASVYFATGSSNIKAGSVRKLLKSAGEGATWHLTGSTDSRGSEELNRRLCASRAESVKQALVAAGVDEANISVEEGNTSGEADPKTYWKLRRVSIRYDGGKGPAVAHAQDAPNATGDKPLSAAEQRRAAAAEQRAAAAEQKRVAAEQRKADAEAKRTESEQKRAAADAQKKADAEAKRTESEQKRAAADAQKKADADQKKADADQKKADADQKKADADKKLAMNTSRSTDPEPRNTAGEKKSLEHINLIYWRALNHALWIVAEQKGFFEAEGFDVSLTETNENARKIADHVGVASGVQSTGALQAGQKVYAAGAVCGFATHEAMAKGDPIVDIGSMIMIPETFLMKKELADEIDKNMKAFKGKRIGDVTYGAGAHEFKYNNVLRHYLERVGLKDQEDFNIVEYNDPNKEISDPPSQKIDIAKVFPPADVEFLRQHHDYVRIPFAKFFPDLPCCRQLVTRSQLKANRGKYVRLLRASIRAHQFTVQHPIEAAEIIGKWLGISPSLVRSSIMSSYVNLTPDPMRKGVEMYQRTNDKLTGTKTATAEYIDTSLYRDALLGLQREDDSPASVGYYNTMISRYRANN